MIDLLAAVPSVVYGLWGVLVLVPGAARLLPGLARPRSPAIPVLDTLFDGDPIAGRSFMTAGLILAIMITPIITSVARETFATVPQSQKDAAHALGATRWEMIRAAVFPHSRSGLIAGDPHRPRPRARRDDRGRARHRLAPADHREALQLGRRAAVGDRQPVR